MRTQYETELDKARELWVMSRFINKKGYLFYKMPKSYRLDFFIQKGSRPQGVVEVKCREITSDQYREDGIMLSLSKWKEGISYARMGIPFFVVFGLLDGVFWYQYSPETAKYFKLCWGGRTVQTRDDADCEPCVHITQYRKVHEGNVFEEVTSVERD